MANGAYTWSLTGTDSSGKALATPTGAAAYTGTVWLQRTAPAATVVLPEIAATSTAYTDRVTASWRPVSNPTGRPLRYDVQTRQASGAGAFSPAVTYPGDVTTTSHLMRWQAFERGMQGRTQQVSVRTRDALGNVGAWSPWRGTALAVDDAAADTRSAGWTVVRGPSSYNGSVLRATTAGRTLTVSGDGRVVGVLGARCPTCGRVRVTVDGRSVVVDTRASTAQHRQVLARFAVPSGPHRVTVTTVATAGRPTTMVDGFAFLR